MRFCYTFKPLFISCLISLLLASGCVANPTDNPGDALLLETDLINGTALFGAPNEANESELPLTLPPAETVLAMTPEMSAFTSARVRRGMPPADRARALVRTMVSNGFFPDGYYTEHTRTAAEVFEKRSGNCLSYTNLFVAMARHLGLDARYQVAHIPAVWSTENGYLVRSRHINVQVRDPRMPPSEWVTVDFNKVATSSLYPHSLVSDSLALSAFYNNLAIDELYQQNYRASVRLLAQAIQTHPTNGDAWVNLAAVYSRNKKFAEAKRAYETALIAEPNNESASAGMLRLLRETGDFEEAELFAEEMRLRRERNPYFHFAMAQAAYDQNAMRQSLTHVNRAIELRNNVGAFYYLRALLEYNRGNLNAARASLADAQARKRSLPPKKQEHVLLLAERLSHASAETQSLPPALQQQR